LETVEEDYKVIKAELYEGVNLKTMILAGGFGTRMGPLAEMPKAMIVVEGKTLLDHLIRKFKDEPIITTNRKFEKYFEGYKNVLIEEAMSDEEKPGAVSAINNAIKTLRINDDLFVLCSDNYFSVDFKEFSAAYTGEPLIGVYYVGDKPELKPQELGTLSFDGSDRHPPPKRSFLITKFQEKSSKQLSKYVSVGAYVFPKKIFPILEKYCKDKKRDDIGKFIEHLLESGVKIKGHVFSGEWYDISHKSFFQVFSAAKMMKSDERYVVCDLPLGHLVLSTTILHPSKETRGHSHPVSEIYLFLEGEGRIEVGGVERSVGSKDVVPIKPEEFHRVRNTSNKDLVFISIFEKYADRG